MTAPLRCAGRRGVVPALLLQVCQLLSDGTLSTAVGAPMLQQVLARLAPSDWLPALSAHLDIGAQLLAAAARLDQHMACVSSSGREVRESVGGAGGGRGVMPAACEARCNKASREVVIIKQSDHLLLHSGVLVHNPRSAHCAMPRRHSAIPSELQRTVR